MTTLTARAMLNCAPYANLPKPELPPWETVTEWPCQWIAAGVDVKPPLVAAYCLRFSQEAGTTVRVHVSADERYELFVDGDMVGRGSERGCLANWFFETFDLVLSKGSHVIVARVWSLGGHSPWAQQSIRHRFLFSPDSEAHWALLGTGIAPWSAMLLPGYGYVDYPGFGTGAKLLIDGRIFPWGFKHGEGAGWIPAVNAGRAFGSTNSHLLPGEAVLCPAGLPPMISKPFRAGRIRHLENVDTLDLNQRPVLQTNSLEAEMQGWQAFLGGAALQIPPHRKLRAIVDLENYFTFYPRLIVSGGRDALLRLHWAEHLNNPNGQNGSNDIIENKNFKGIGESFTLDGGLHRCYDTLWWHAGRYLEIVVATAGEPLLLESLQLEETRYPLEMESHFESSDPRLKELAVKAFHTLQSCSHETYMDCPYWEQLMYIGDTRLESLVTYVTTSDSALPEKAIRMFDAARLNRYSLSCCAYPEHGGKIIPSFCLWWIDMIYDFALWRGGRDLVGPMLIGARSTLDIILAARTADGLVITPSGWHFIDWMDFKNWHYGIPPAGAGPCGIFNWLVVYTLLKMAELERFAGEDELAGRWTRLAGNLKNTIDRKFFNQEKGLYADDLTHECFSKHAQCLAILSGALHEAATEKLFGRMLELDAGLASPSIYFSHYLFETYALCGRTDLILEAFAPWYALAEKGLYTTPECFVDQPRSDCHAWGAHPLYHIYVSLLGIRPAGLGGELVIRPDLGTLERLAGSIPFRGQTIFVACEKVHDRLKVEVKIPKEMTAALCHGSCKQVLANGGGFFEL